MFAGQCDSQSGRSLPGGNPSSVNICRFVQFSLVSRQRTRHLPFQRSSPGQRDRFREISMSIIRSILVAAVASASFAGVAYARGEVFTARLVTPVTEQTRVIAVNTLWTCNGDTCLARPNHAASVRSCRQFVRQTGARIVSYGPEGGQLSAAEIARCNGEAETQQAAN